MAEPNLMQMPEGQNWSPELQAEMAAMTTTQRAAVLMLLLGEEQAADIIKFLSPKEVQALGAAMVAAADLSQEACCVAPWVTTRRLRCWGASCLAKAPKAWKF